MANVQRRTGPANNCERELGHIWTEAKTLYHSEMELHFSHIKGDMNSLKRHEGPPDPAFHSLCQESQAKNNLQLQSSHKSVVTQLLTKFNQEHSLDFDQRRKLRSALEFQLEKYNHDLKLLTNSTSRPVLGIDLGTTYCCVAAYHNGSIKIVPNAIGKNTTPSIIAFDGAHSFIGQPAKDQAHQNPQNTIFDAKRLIGRKFLDPIVQKDLQLWPFAVVSDPGNTNTRDNPKIIVEESSYHPEEISGEILKVLKTDAESFLGGIPVTDAVITVPAYFNNGQRKATRDAGTIAGLKVLQILNEPTAAAITYSLDRVEQSKRNVLIFDLGGGTFDVSVLTIENGAIQIKAVGGDTHLGGEDFDNSMVDYCIADFKRKTGLDIRDGKDSPDDAKKFKASKRLRRLRNECEKQKVALSFAPRAIVAIDSIQDSEDLQVIFTREHFEQLIEDKLVQCIETVDQVIRDIPGIQKQDIHDIVLVGGSSRIPKIQKMLQDYFEREDLRKSVHPDEAVAHGAAIRACLLSEGAEHDKLKESLTISDVIPLSVGIQIRDGDFARIIPKNTPIPFSITKKYVTRYNNQTVMRLPIYEGEDRLAKNNHYLGEIQLENIPPGPAGAEQCEVVMRINSDGIFKVEATALGNAESQKEIQISMYFDRPQREEVGVYEKADVVEPGKNAWYV